MKLQREVLQSSWRRPSIHTSCSQQLNERRHEATLENMPATVEKRLHTRKHSSAGALAKQQELACASREAAHTHTRGTSPSVRVKKVSQSAIQQHLQVPQLIWEEEGSRATTLEESSADAPVWAPAATALLVMEMLVKASSCRSSCPFTHHHDWMDQIYPPAF